MFTDPLKSLQGPGSMDLRLITAGLYEDGVLHSLYMNATAPSFQILKLAYWSSFHLNRSVFCS